MKFLHLTLLFVFLFSPVVYTAWGQAAPTPERNKQEDMIKSDKFVAKAQEYREKGNLEGALRFLEMALIQKKNLKDSSGIANIHTIQSNIYQKQENQVKAISSILNAIKIHEALDDQRNTAMDYDLLGTIYVKQKEYGNAEESFLAAYTIFKDFADRESQERMASLLISLSEINLKQKQMETALEYAESGVELNSVLNNREGVARSKLSIGNVYRQLKNYKLAEKYYEESLDPLKEDEFPFLQADIYHQLAKVYLKQKKLKSALSYANKARDILEPSPSVDDLRDTYKTLSKIYEAKKQPFTALEYYKKYLEFSETSFNEENKRIERELLTKYDSEKKETEIKLLEQEQKTKEEAIQKQRFQIISFGILGLLLAILAIGLIYYNRNINSAKDQIALEKERSEKLLLNILPKDVAAELKENGKYKARSFPQASVLFVDIAGFTQYAETLSPEALVKDIDTYFSAFDEIVGRFGMEKIKTIGDAYMVAGGLQGDPKNAAIKMVEMGVAFQEEVRAINSARKEARQEVFEMRMGIHTGPVVAGIVGSRKFAYDIWGDTVNIASRMQSSGEVNKLNISQDTYELVKEQFACTHRGKIDAKNKGAVEMYFVSARKII